MSARTQAGPGADVDEALQSCVGEPIGDVAHGRDPVNVAMIRNWCDALDDHNPVYLDTAAARRYGFADVVAPPAMLRTWTMLAPDEQLDPPPSAVRTVYDVLEDAGFTSKAGTNCNHTFVRYLSPGDEVSARTTLLAVSNRKTTALGTGYFVDTNTTYRDGTGAVVAEMMWRSLRYRPESPGGSAPDGGKPAAAAAAAAAPALPTTAHLRPGPPAVDIAITPTLIIAGAMASRDYQFVHHDRDRARTQGVPDFFMNMMTSAGLVSRYVTDWAGPAARIRKLDLRLGVPNHPGDTMRLDATVTAASPEGDGQVVTLAVGGRNSLGTNVYADVLVYAPAEGGRS